MIQSNPRISTLTISQRNFIHFNHPSHVIQHYNPPK